MSKSKTRKTAAEVLDADGALFKDALKFAFFWLFQNKVLLESERASIKVVDGKEASVVTRRMVVDMEGTTFEMLRDYQAQRKSKLDDNDIAVQSAFELAIGAFLQIDGYTMENAVYCTTEARTNEVMDDDSGECHIDGCDHAIPE